MTFTIDRALSKDIDPTWLGNCAPELFRDYLAPPPDARGRHLANKFHLLLGDETSEIYYLRENATLLAIIGIEYLKWDSEHFSIPCARLSPYCLDGRLAEEKRHAIHQQLLAFCLERAVHNDIKLLQRRLLSMRLDEIRVLEALGFRLTDNVVTLLANTTDITATSTTNHTLQFHPATNDDIEYLALLTRGAFPYNRFVNEPLFSKERGQEVYVRWIENLLNATISAPWPKKTWIDICYIGDQAAGYIAFQLDHSAPPLLGQDLGAIELIVVDSHYRGLGIGRQLLAQAARTLHMSGAKRIETSTWINQKAAMASNQKAGFRVHENLLTFHCNLAE